MSDQRFFEIETALAAVSAGAKRINAPVSSEALIEGMSIESREALNAILLDLFLDLPPQNVSVTSDAKIPQAMRDFGLRIGSIRKSGESLPTTMRFLRVKASWLTVTINLIGLSIAFTLASPTAVVPALTIIKTCFDNLVKLERDSDEDAMRCYESIVRWRAENSGIDAVEWPTLDGIVSQCARLSSETALDVQRAQAALIRLEGLGLVSVVKWGGAGGALEDRGNKWKTIL